MSKPGVVKTFHLNSPAGAFYVDRGGGLDRLARAFMTKHGRRAVVMPGQLRFADR